VKALKISYYSLSFKKNIYSKVIQNCR